MDLIEKAEMVEKNLALIKEKTSLLEDKKIKMFYNLRASNDKLIT